MFLCSWYDPLAAGFLRDGSQSYAADPQLPMEDATYGLGLREQDTLRRDAATLIQAHRRGWLAHRLVRMLRAHLQPAPVVAPPPPLRRRFCHLPSRSDTPHPTGACGLHRYTPQASARSCGEAAATLQDVWRSYSWVFSLLRRVFFPFPGASSEHCVMGSCFED